MKVRTLVAGTVIALVGCFVLAPINTAKAAPLVRATHWPKTRCTKSIKGNSGGATKRTTSGIRDSKGTGTRIPSRSGSGGAPKATSGTRGSRGTGTIKATAGRVTAGNSKAAA